MQTWFILACVSTVMIVASTFCAKWSQRLGTPVLDYVTGRIILQTIVIASVWFALTHTQMGRTWLESSWGVRFLGMNRDGASRRGVRAGELRQLFGWPQLVTALLFATLGLTAVAAIQTAPNPGYPASVLSTSALFVALLAPLIFPNVSLSMTTLIGVVLVAIGMTLVAFTAPTPSVATAAGSST